MANDEIVGKLARYTYAYPEDEASVVYLIVQIGKIIERQNASADFPSLWFYRNWVAHPKLHKRGADGRSEMLRKLNNAVLAVVEKRGNDILPRLEEAISLKNLHKEIALFFNDHYLARPEVNYIEWFKKFDTLLIDILVDLPLIPPKDDGHFFTEFRFKKARNAMSDPEFEIQVLPSANHGIPLTIGGRVRAEVEDLQWTL